MAAWFGHATPVTIRATVWERDGELLGIAGYYMDGVAVVFSESKPGLPKLAIWREAKAFMAGLNIPAVCITEEGGPFLERLGWIKGEDGDYLWQP